MERGHGQCLEVKWCGVCLGTKHDRLCAKQEVKEGQVGEVTRD